MLKLTTTLLHALYSPKIIRLNLAKNPPPSPPQQKQQLSEQLKKRTIEEVTMRTLRKSVEEQEGGGSKEEQILNRAIKEQTRVSALLKLHKAHYLEFTPRNMINLLVKVLELRQINTKEQEPEKLQPLLNIISKKVGKFSPEDMIRLLHSFKKVTIRQADFILLSPLLRLILQEFAARTNETSSKHENEFESFYVISLQANIKLLHALNHLHILSGSEFEPIITSLIRGSLFYFYRLTRKDDKEKLLHSGKTVSWSFYISFIRLAGQYNMPAEAIVGFVRAFNLQKRAYQGNYSYLFAIEQMVHSSPSLRQHCRGAAISHYLDVFHIHLFIYELVEKPNELIKMRPFHLLNHAHYLADFTQEEVTALDFNNLRTTTLERLLRFTLTLYQKYFNNSYSNENEKNNIEKWVQDGEKSTREYLGEFICHFHYLAQQKIIRNEADLNQLITLCVNHFAALNPHTQIVLLRMTLQQHPQTCKPLLDIFFRRGEKAGEVRRYKKSIEADAYSQLFPYWNQMQQLASITVDAYSEGCFLKFFFIRLIKTPNIQQNAQFFAIRIANDRPFLFLIVKQYVKFSEFNRSLGKTFSEKSQSPEFRRELDSCERMLANEDQDGKKWNEFWQLKKSIRLNMRRGLIAFKFMIELLQALSKQTGSPNLNITQSTLFRELFIQFDEEMKCLHFQQLLTAQIYDLVSDITTYLQVKGSFDEKSEIYKIAQQKSGNTLMKQNKSTSI